MNSTSKAVIKNLNDRLLAQSVIVETLIDIIIDNDLVTEEELEKMILDNHESQMKYLEELKKKETSNLPFVVKQTKVEDDEEFLERLYFGPMGEA